MKKVLIALGVVGAVTAIYFAASGRKRVNVYITYSQITNGQIEVRFGHDKPTSVKLGMAVMSGGVSIGLAPGNMSTYAVSVNAGKNKFVDIYVNGTLLANQTVQGQIDLPKV